MPYKRLKIYVKMMTVILAFACIAPFFFKSCIQDPLSGKSSPDFGQKAKRIYHALKNTGAAIVHKTRSFVLYLKTKISTRRQKPPSAGRAINETGKAVKQNAPDPVAGEKPIIIYRWKGKDGAWRFSDHPNPNGPCETVYMDRDKGATSLPDLPDPSAGTNSATPKSIKTNPVSKMTDAVKKATAVKKEIEAHYEEKVRHLDDSQ